MADHSKPTLSSTYHNFLAEMKGRLEDASRQFDPAQGESTNVPSGTIRWTSASKRWERWSGTAWDVLSTEYGISISGSAAKLKTARSIVLSGGAKSTPVNFDGSADITLEVTEIDPTKLSAAVPVDKGGTGATTAQAARESLGLSDALSASKNLSELTDKPKARENLGLGDSAVRHVGTAPGDVLINGHCWGLGGYVKHNTNNSASCIETYNDGLPLGNYPQGAYAWGSVLRMLHGYAGDCSEIAVTHSGDSLFFRGSKNDGFRAVWHSGNFNPNSKANNDQWVEQFPGAFPYSRLYNTPYIPPPQQDIGLGNVGQLALVRSRYRDTADAKLPAGSIVSGSVLSIVDMISREWDTHNRRQLGFSDRSDILGGAWRVLNSSNQFAPFTPTEYGVYLAVRIS